MNRSQAKHALRMNHVKDIDDGQLYKVDDDVWIYNDWVEDLQHTLTELVNGDILISSTTFDDVVQRMDAEEAQLYTEMEQYATAEAVGLCPECLQLEKDCICPDYYQ